MVQEKEFGMEVRKKRVLSFFSGAGGMDLGLEGDFLAPGKSVDGSSEGWARVPATSFTTVFANDILKDARTAWTGFFSKRGHSPEVYHLESIVELVRRHEAGESVFPSDIDVVTGGFPCQDFSVAGKRLGFDSNKNDLGKRRDDEGEFSETSRGKLYYWMKRVIDIVKPKIFIAENVKGLVSLGDALDIIRKDFAGDGGYFVLEPQILKAWEYGVPETRERVIFIGIRRDAMKDGVEESLNKETIIYKETGDSSKLKCFPYPVKTHGDSKFPLVVCRDVLGHLREPSEETDDLAQKAYSTARFLGKGKQGQTEIKWNGLAPTIRSEHHGNIEYRRLCTVNGGKMTEELEQGKPERRLTVRECALIQTFPPDYEFIIKRDGVKLTQSGAYKVIGNAVPPVLAYKIARRLEDVWENLFGKEK